MDEVSRYAVGLDVGTENVRAVVMSVSRDGSASVIGYGEAPNSGMRKGVVANLAGPASSIDKMLAEVERMSGQEVNSAFVSANGATVMSVKTEGMIAVGTEDHEINEDDLERVENAAVIGRVPANRTILDVLPLSYTLDGQNGIKDPIGMTGSRLEIKASVISMLAPNATNLMKATEGANVVTERLVPSVMAAAKAVLNERQMENGVAIIDFGAATTSVAIYEEGDLQYLNVIPLGSVNITNDLAIMLQIDTELADEIKKRYVSCAFTEMDKDIVIRKGREELTFKKADIDEIVKARLGEILNSVKKEIKTAKYDRRLPEGVVLVGGGSKLREIAEYAKEILESSIKIGEPHGFGGVSDAVEKPEYATAVGLALYATMNSGAESTGGKKAAKKKAGKKSSGFLTNFFKKF